jgi:hypothetical protein
MTAQSQLESILPLACEWAARHEAAIVNAGAPLRPPFPRDALAVGVRHPEKVRLLSVPTIPIPDHPLLRAAAEETALISQNTIGLALRYGIMIREDHWNCRRTIVHELAHTWQYEQLGGISPFLAQYLHECLTDGYAHSPLELEAIAIERAVVGTGVGGHYG